MNDTMTGELRSRAGENSKHVRYERRDDEPVSVTTATALAAYHDEDITTVSTRLYDYIDPEALDALFADKYDGTTRALGQITFDVAGATVEITPESVQVYSF